MRINWKVVGGAGSIISGIAVMHGLKTRKWRHIHTLGVFLGIAAGLAPFVKGANALRAELVSTPDERDPAAG